MRRLRRLQNEERLRVGYKGTLFAVPSLAASDVSFEMGVA